MSGSRAPSPVPAPPANGPIPPTGEHGDLLDLIARARNLDRLGDVLDEARTFLSLPRPERISPSPTPPAPSGSPEAARRLFRAGRSLIGTPAEAYLRARGITASLRWPSLRYHPSVYYRAHEDAPREIWPALLAAVTDLEGRITGLHRTWLDPAHSQQGAARRSAKGARPSARQRRPLWRCQRCRRRRRGHRDDARAEIDPADLAHDRRPFGQPSRRTRSAARRCDASMSRCDNDEAGRLAAVRLRDRAAGARTRDVRAHTGARRLQCRSVPAGRRDAAPSPRSATRPGRPSAVCAGCDRG